MWEKAKKIASNPVFTHIGILLLAICAFLLYLRYVPPAPPPYQSQPGSVVVAPAPPKAKIVTKIVQGPERIVYIEKTPLAQSLKMPELNYINDNVIAVATVAPHRGRTTAVATIGPDSDNVYRGNILLRQEPVPFWGWEREWHGGVWYGPAGRNILQGEIEFLPMRIGPVYPSVKGVVGLEDGGNVNGQLLIGVRF